MSEAIVLTVDILKIRGIIVDHNTMTSFHFFACKYCNMKKVVTVRYTSNRCVNSKIIFPIYY